MLGRESRGKTRLSRDKKDYAQGSRQQWNVSWFLKPKVVRWRWYVLYLACVSQKSRQHFVPQKTILRAQCSLPGIRFLIILKAKRLNILKDEETLAYTKINHQLVGNGFEKYFLGRKTFREFQGTETPGSSVVRLSVPSLQNRRYFFFCVFQASGGQARGERGVCPSRRAWLALALRSLEKRKRKTPVLQASLFPPSPPPFFLPTSVPPSLLSLLFAF